MKDIKQNIIIVLLVVVMIGIIVLYSGQKSFEGRMEAEINNIQSTVYSSTSGLSAELSRQVTDALLSEKFLVADMTTDFKKQIVRGDIIEGDIYFTLTENKDIEELYVIVQEDNKDSLMKIEAENLGSLRYKAHVTFEDIASYNYYVLGVSSGGDEMMLSYKSYLDLRDRVYERAYLTMESAGASSNRMYFDGFLHVHRKFDIEKVEWEFVKVDDYSKILSDEVEVIKTVDITESVSEASWADFEHVNEYYYETYELYNLFKIDTEYIAGDTENLMEEFIDYRIVVTFTDGSSEKLF